MRKGLLLEVKFLSLCIFVIRHTTQYYDYIDGKPQTKATLGHSHWERHGFMYYN